MSDLGLSFPCDRAQEVFPERQNLRRRGAGAALETSKSQLCTRSEGGQLGDDQSSEEEIHGVCASWGTTEAFLTDTLI